MKEERSKLPRAASDERAARVGNNGDRRFFISNRQGNQIIIALAVGLVTVVAIVVAFASAFLGSGWTRMPRAFEPLGW